ncbi:MAG: hypothetical protein V1755_06055 [Chloroflexota bacterium]
MVPRPLPELEHEVLALGVKLGDIDVPTCRALNVLETFPQRERDKLGYIGVMPLDDMRA